jgi:hypothetical protein
MTEAVGICGVRLVTKHPENRRQRPIWNHSAPKYTNIRGLNIAASDLHTTASASVTREFFKLTHAIANSENAWFLLDPKLSFLH